MKSFSRIVRVGKKIRGGILLLHCVLGVGACDSV